MAVQLYKDLTLSQHFIEVLGRLRQPSERPLFGQADMPIVEKGLRPHPRRRLLPCSALLSTRLNPSDDPTRDLPCRAPSGISLASDLDLWDLAGLSGLSKPRANWVRLFRKEKPLRSWVTAPRWRYLFAASCRRLRACETPRQVGISQFMEIYLQEVAASSFVADLPAGSRHGVQKTAELFESTLRKAHLWWSAGVPFPPPGFISGNTLGYLGLTGQKFSCDALFHSCAWPRASS